LKDGGVARIPEQTWDRVVRMLFRGRKVRSRPGWHRVFHFACSVRTPGESGGVVFQPSRVSRVWDGHATASRSVEAAFGTADDYV
jgi:hypothetical protein